jgi:hypothetical protein
MKWREDPDAAARRARQAGSDPGTVIAVMRGGRRKLLRFSPAEPAVQTGNPELHLGFGGMPWRVKFLDGRVVETNNLGDEGDIPERWHHLFPVNAVLEQVGWYGGDRYDGGPPMHLPGYGAA